MRLTFALAVVLVAAALALPAGSTPPSDGVFVPGQSLGGVRLGMTQAEVLDAWGPEHGVCTDCDATTWYFNSVPFAPEGAGAIFAEGVAVQLFTVWKPSGWHTPDGLELGAPEADVPGEPRRLRGADVRRLHGDPRARRGRGQRVLRLRRVALGLRAHAPGAQPVPVSPSAAGSSSSPRRVSRRSG